MADIEQQLHEDRALRNAAKQLVTTGLGNVKGDMAQKGLAERVVDRAKDGAADIAENTADYAGGHRAQVGTGIAVGALALVGWLFRDRLADAIYDLLDGSVPEQAPPEEAVENVEQLAEDPRSLID